MCALAWRLTGADRGQGRILWTMGGAMRDDPKEARAHFEIASCEECDSQARSRPQFLGPTAVADLALPFTLCAGLGF